MDFPRIYTEEEDEFDPDLNVKASYILQKHISPKFTEQQRFEANQILQGWKEGVATAKYRITQIFSNRDAIEIENVEDATDKRVLEFDYYGIPENEPFDILNVIHLEPEPKTQTEGEEAEAEEESEAESNRGEDEEDQEVLEPSIKGTFRYVYVPATQEVEEVGAAKERITEEVQKNSALSDFINMLPPKDQKDPLIVRDFRILVEVMNQMKNDITDYADDGTVNGIIDPSVTTFGDLIKRIQVPNGRPVFRMNKRLYVRHPNKKDESIDGELHKDDFYTVNDINEMDNYKGRVGFPSTSKAVVGDQLVTTSNFYETQIYVNTHYKRPWKGVNTKNTVPIKLVEDIQAFRNILPDLEDEIIGYMPIADPMTDEQRRMALIFKNPPPYPHMTELVFGTEQVLTSSYRKGEKEGKVTLLPSEANTELVSYILFPNRVSDLVGSKRSGSLALDMARALEQKLPMITIIDDLGGIQEPGTMSSKTILTMKVGEGNVLTNYMISPYLEGMVLKCLNYAEFTLYLEDMGISRLDYNIDILAVLHKKMTMTQARLKMALNEQREKMKGQIVSEPNPILAINKETLIGGEPFLKEALKSFERENEVLKESDVAFFVYMLKHYNDFFQAKLGGKESIISQERLNVVKHRELEQREIAAILMAQELEGNRAPIPNTCKHVAELKGIRREEDEIQFYKKLGIFLAKYQGGNNEKWTDCRICHQHLLCAHERLMIKIYLYPTEKEAIQKTLHLQFSGGLSGGQYICRNCGQGMEDLGFDNTMQYDDEGRPMNGNAPIIDEEELDNNELEKLLKIPLEDDEQIKRDDTETEYYDILKDLAINVGLNLKTKTYTKMIQHLNTFATAFIGAEEKIKLTAQTRTYATYKYRLLVSAAAVLILIEAQTALIEYTPFKTLVGCAKPEFGGYPLDEDNQNTTGIQYMACNIYSFIKYKTEREPWKHVSYILGKGKTSESDVQTAIRNYLINLTTLILNNNQILEQVLVKKRVQISESDEPGARFKDVIPSTFLPNNREYKDLVIEKTVAESSRNARLQALYWLKSGDVLAKENASNLLDPLALSILCCRSPVNDPTIFWKEKQASLIHFSENRMLVPRRAANSLQPHFIPRLNEAIITEIPKEKLYALFLKVCYTGDNIGRSHEPDITHRCIWCGFEFGKPYSLMNTEDAIKAVANNKITTDMEQFQALLDRVHVNNDVKMPVLMTGEAATVVSKAKEDFVNMTPPPIPGWKELYETVDANLELLSKKETVDALDLADALSPLSLAIQPMKEAVLLKYSSTSKEDREITNGLNKIVTLNWTNFVQVLLTYFLKPCQNIVFNYQVRVPLAYTEDKEIKKKMAQDHIRGIIDMINTDRSINIHFSELAQNNVTNSLAHTNLKMFIEQISNITSFKNRINPAYFVGREETFRIFKETFLYGTLATLYDPELHDTGDVGVSKKAISETIPAMIGETVQNFLKQSLTYDDERVKLIIADSAEKEKQVMLNWLKTLPEDERRLMKINQSLKLGRFALGANWKKFAQYSAEVFNTRSQEINDMSAWGSLRGETPATNSGNASGYHEGLNQHAED
jgi:hypothetical protein